MSKFRDFEKYEVFEDGRIWSYKSNKFLKPRTQKGGYQRVCLYDNECKKKWYLLHRVVWEAVTGEPIPYGLQVNHIDENKTNNHINNLNLMTPKENMNWGTGLERSAKAKTNGKCSKKVGAYRNGELVMVFPSTMEAQRSGFHHSAVGKCCNGKLTHYKGYEWRFI